MSVSDLKDFSYGFLGACCSRLSWALRITLCSLCRPLINVCDRHDMVTDLTHYLFSNSMLRYIEGYVQKVNPAKAPQVVGGLLDAEASDDFINNLILSVRSLIPVEQLCAEVHRLSTHTSSPVSALP